MRIVHILTRLLRAGSEENTLLTVAGQISGGHEVFLIHGHEAAPDHARRSVPGLRLICAPHLTREIRLAWDLRAVLEIARELRRLAPDVVHTHQSKAGIVGRTAAAMARVPKIVHGVHILPFLGQNDLRKSAYLLAERIAAQVTDAFVHVSEGVRTECLAHGVGVGRPHYVVRSGFDLERFSRGAIPDDWAAILDTEPVPAAGRPPVIAMLSALEPRKNHIGLVDALPALVARIPNLRLLLAGEGHLKEAIAARIAEKGLESHVRLLGYREDPERIIALSDVCVHCSDREGLPRSVLQYLAGGRPVVMFDLPGIEDVVASGRNGIVVPHGDWRALSDALARLLMDPRQRAALAAGARDTDLRRWNGALMGDAVSAVYGTNIEGGGCQVGPIERGVVERHGTGQLGQALRPGRSALDRKRSEVARPKKSTAHR